MSRGLESPQKAEPLVAGPIALGRGASPLDVASPLPTRLLGAQELAPSCTVTRHAMDDEFPELGQLS